MRYAKINENTYVNLDNTFKIYLWASEQGWRVVFVGNAISGGEDLEAVSKPFSTKEEAEAFLNSILYGE